MEGVGRCRILKCLSTWYTRMLLPLGSKEFSGLQYRSLDNLVVTLLVRFCTVRQTVENIVVIISI